jgi:hypothetical protein
MVVIPSEEITIRKMDKFSPKELFSGWMLRKKRPPKKTMPVSNNKMRLQRLKMIVSFSSHIVISRRVTR